MRLFTLLILALSGLPVFGGSVNRTETLTETILYATGGHPRYNGTPSARTLTQGGRYDYIYDELDRLVAAEYSAEDGSGADFSTAYTYDVLSRPLTVQRYGVVDVDGTTETFGLLDDITFSYTGQFLSTVRSNRSAVQGRQFLGRTGWADGTYMEDAGRSYNTAGRLVQDQARQLHTIQYNSLGLPVMFSSWTNNLDNSPHTERVYDASGRKLRQTQVELVRGVRTVTADRRYAGCFTFNADTLERVDFPGGYFDGQGNAHFMFTDWQGNVTIVTDRSGQIEQHNGYYPYGEMWREPRGQRQTLFAAKERQTGTAAGTTDFGPRGLCHPFPLWDAPDLMAAKYPFLSPWTYCAANPIANTDPTGNVWYQKNNTNQFTWFNREDQFKGYTKIGKEGSALGEFEKHIDKLMVEVYNTGSMYTDGFTFEKTSPGKGAINNDAEGEKSFFNEFVSGSGSEFSILDDQHPYTQDLMDHKIIHKAQKMIMDGETKIQGCITDVKVKWDVGDVVTTKSMARQFIGSFRYDAFTSNDGKSILNIVSDSKSKTSLFLHIPFFNNERRSETSNFGNTYQFYIWTTQKSDL